MRWHIKHGTAKVNEDSSQERKRLQGARENINEPLTPKLGAHLAENGKIMPLVKVLTDLKLTLETQRKRRHKDV